MKTSLIFAVFLFALLLSEQAATQSLESCAAIENPAERLVCYDTLAGRLPAKTVKSNGTAPGAVEPLAPRADVIVPPAPSVTPTAPAVELIPDAEAVFGLEHKLIPEEKLLDELQLKWTKKKKDAYGKWIITLENGQVWRQTDSRHFNFVNSEQLVVISRGFLGSFFMGEPERNVRIRVKRVK